MFGRFWFLHSKFVLVYVFLLFFEENTFVLCLNTSHLNDNFEPIKNSVRGYRSSLVKNEKMTKLWLNQIQVTWWMEHARLNTDKQRFQWRHSFSEIFIFITTLIGLGWGLD